MASISASWFMELKSVTMSSSGPLFSLGSEVAIAIRIPLRHSPARSGRLQRRVNRALEVLQHTDCMSIAEREELHRHHRANLPVRVDPEEGVVHSSPRQAACCTAGGIVFAVNQE